MADWGDGVSASCTMDLWVHSIEQPGRQPVTRSQWNASGRPIGDRPAAGKRPAARHRRFHGFLKIDGLGIFTLFGAGHRFLKIDGRFHLDE